MLKYIINCIILRDINFIILLLEHFVMPLFKFITIIININIITMSLAISPYPIPKRVFQKVPTSAPSFKFQYLVISLRSSSSCIRRLPCPPIPCVIPSVACFSKQFLRKTRPIQLAPLGFIECRMSLSSLTLRNYWVDLLHFFQGLPAVVTNISLKMEI